MGLYGHEDDSTAALRRKLQKDAADKAAKEAADIEAAKAAAKANPANKEGTLAGKPVSGGGDVHTTQTDPNSEDPLDPVNAPAGQQAAYASKSWQAKMPGYIAGQEGGAQDAARLALATQLQNARASANARGLLYSGTEAGDEAQVKADVGGKLASNLTDIHSQAMDITAKKNSLAQQEARGEDANNLSYQQMQIDSSQSAYELALAAMKNENNYYGDIAKGAVTAAGTIAMFL